MLWSGKGETLGLSDFAAVEKHWESQEKGIIQRLSHSRGFRPVMIGTLAPPVNACSAVSDDFPGKKDL